MVGGGGHSPVVELDEVFRLFRLGLGFDAQRLRVQREYVLELIGSALDEKRSCVHVIWSVKRLRRQQFGTMTKAPAVADVYNDDGSSWSVLSCCCTDWWDLLCCGLAPSSHNI